MTYEELLLHTDYNEDLKVLSPVMPSGPGRGAVAADPLLKIGDLDELLKPKPSAADSLKPMTNLVVPPADMPFPKQPAVESMAAKAGSMVAEERATELSRVPAAILEKDEGLFTLLEAVADQLDSRGNNDPEVCDPRASHASEYPLGTSNDPGCDRHDHQTILKPIGWVSIFWANTDRANHITAQQLCGLFFLLTNQVFPTHRKALCTVSINATINPENLEKMLLYSEWEWGHDKTGNTLFMAVFPWQNRGQKLAINGKDTGNPNFHCIFIPACILVEWHCPIYS